MQRYFPVFFIFGLALLLPAAAGAALQTALLSGRVLDVDDRPVAGAMVMVYDSDDVRRPADFTSPATGSDGAYQVTVPPGTYWVVAVQRKSGAAFGPLQLGDRHSGSPMKITLGAGAQKKRNFTVLDLRDAARAQVKENSGLVTVRGRVVDGRGRPAAMAWVAADRRPRFRDFPEFISAWTDADGRFTLYLEPGRYHIGALRGWPPVPGTALAGTVDCPENVDGLELSLAGDGKKK